jgi:hypothetical protein
MKTLSTIRCWRLAGVVGALAVGVLFALSAAVPALAEHTRFWRQSDYENFNRGTAKGTALRSDGKIMLAPKTKCDLETVQAVITHRYDVLARYAGSLKQTCAEEIRRLKAAHAMRVDRKLVKRWLHSD